MTSESFQQFAQQWFTPAILIGVIAVIVFVVQIDSKTTVNSQDVAEVKKAQQAVEQDLREIAMILERTTAIQKAISSNLQQLDMRLETNRKLIIDNRDRVNRHPPDVGHP